jgi:hypothetical protein
LQTANPKRIATDIFAIDYGDSQACTLVRKAAIDPAAFLSSSSFRATRPERLILSLLEIA